MLASVRTSGALALPNSLPLPQKFDSLVTSCVKGTLGSLGHHSFWLNYAQDEAINLFIAYFVKLER